MRLTAEEVQAIQEAVHAEDPSARVYLYGSRLDDTRKGGDIDLYVETARNTRLLQLKARILHRQWSRLGVQRIDLLLRSQDTPLQAIHRMIRQNGVKL
jgi:predicted nucleotidyltransferase